jgi:hypothetical protein
VVGSSNQGNLETYLDNLGNMGPCKCSVCPYAKFRAEDVAAANLCEYQAHSNLESDVRGEIRNSTSTDWHDLDIQNAATRYATSKLPGHKYLVSMAADMLDMLRR